MEDAKNGKYVCDSEAEQVHVVMPQHLNGYGKLFGGQLAAWIDVIAGVVAVRHCRMQITTAAIDNLRFRESVGSSEIVVMRGRMVHTGVTSMEVKVDSFVEHLKTGELKLINTAFVIEVALDENNRPQPVPPLIPRTPEEIRDFEMGCKRREMRRKKNDLYG